MLYTYQTILYALTQDWLYPLLHYLIRSRITIYHIQITQTVRFVLAVISLRFLWRGILGVGQACTPTTLLPPGNDLRGHHYFCTLPPPPLSMVTCHFSATISARYISVPALQRTISQHHDYQRGTAPAI